MRVPFLRDPYTGRYKYIRRVKQKWQARPWIGGSRVNLGLFGSEWEAAKAVAEWYHSRRTTREKLPKYVRRRSGGQFEARVILPGHPPKVEHLGLFPSVAEAETAVRKHLIRKFGLFAEMFLAGR